MSWRKFGALRYGMVFAAVAIVNQTLPVDPAVVSISAPDATLVQPTPGVPILIPFQRPVFQRGIRTIGPSGPSGTPSATQSLQADAHTIAVSAPPPVVVAGASALSAGENTIAIFAPTASVSLATGRQAGAQSIAISAPTAALAAGGASLVAGQTAIAISAPVINLAASGATPSVPIFIGRPVFERGIRWYGPPAPSVTPETNKVLAAGPQTIAVSAPTALLASGGDARTPLLYLRITQVLRPTHPTTPRGYSNSWGVILGNGAFIQSLSVGAQTIAVSAPTAILAQTGDPRLPQPLTRIRLVAQTRQTPPSGRSIRHGFVVTTVAGGASQVSAGAQTIAISAPVAAPISGAVSRAAGANTVAVSAPTATITQARILSANAQTIAVSATDPLLRLRIPAGAQAVAVSAPAVTVATAKTLAAGANSVAISAPTATRSIATVRQANAQTIAVSAPTVTVAVSAVTRPAGAQGIALSAPVAVRLATFVRTAAGNTVAISAPTASRVIGASPVLAGAQTVVVSAPDARLLGATTLPDFAGSFLESRQDEHTIQTRTGNTLETRTGINLLEAKG